MRFFRSYVLFVYTLFELTDASVPYDSINLCPKHLQISEFSNSKNSLIKFKNEIFDDNCNLKKYHIDICQELLFNCNICEKCMILVSNNKLLCKNCCSQNSSSLFCINCQELDKCIKTVGIFKLCLNKFILGKNESGTVDYFFEKLRFCAPGDSFLLFVLSEVSLNSENMKNLALKFKISIDEFEIIMEDEIKILNICAKYHSELENIDSIDLFKQLIEENDIYPDEYIYYLAFRFNFDFYCKITSFDLFNLIKAVKFRRFELNKEEFLFFIKYLIMKTSLMGIDLDKEDFYELIDLFISSGDSTNFLIYFFEKEKYIEMLTEEKLILMLMKIFNMKSIKLIYPLSNSRLFTDLNDILQDDKNDLSNGNSNLQDNTALLDFKRQYLIYRSMILLLFDNFSAYTPDGIVKIACIIFSFLNPEINQQSIFKELLKKFYSALNFTNLNLEHVLDIIDLHLAYAIPYDYVTPTIQPIFRNIKSCEDFDTIFDYIFNSSNKKIMVGILVNKTKYLTKTKLNKLVAYLIDNISHENIKLLKIIKNNGFLTLIDQIKFIRKIIIKINVPDFDLFEYADKKVFNYLTKRDFTLLLKFCLRNKKYKTILEFIGYLDLKQLEKIPDQDYNLILGEISEAPDKFEQNVFKYLETPFFDTKFLTVFKVELFKMIEKESDSYMKTKLQSVLMVSLF